MSEVGLRWVDSDLLVSLSNPSGLAGEQYRKMGIRLLGLQESLDGEIRVVLVTSPLMGDGKTNTAVNMAVTLSQEEGRRVLLADFDVRKPRLWSYFRGASAQGLAEVVMGEVSAESAIRRTDRIPLDVLTLKRNSDRRLDPLPLERVRTVLRDLRTKYDFVICDAPPILPIADTAALARLSDGIIVVVRAGITPRHAVARALEGIDRSKLIGFVLNGIAERAIGAYYYRYHPDGAAPGEGSNGSGT